MLPCKANDSLHIRPLIMLYVPKYKIPNIFCFNRRYNFIQNQVSFDKLTRCEQKSLVYLSCIVRIGWEKLLGIYFCFARGNWRKRLRVFYNSLMCLYIPLVTICTKKSYKLSTPTDPQSVKFSSKPIPVI